MTPTSEDSSPPDAADVAAPFLRVVKGDPTPEELAALVSVLAALGAPVVAPARRTPEWNAPRRLHRAPQHHAPGAWRASGMPR